MAYNDSFLGFDDVDLGEPPRGSWQEPKQRSPLAFELGDWDALSRFAGAAPPQDWLIGNVIPRKAARLIAAAGDTGKSFTALELGMRVTGGPISKVEQPIFGGFVQSYGATVLITAEDSS